MLIRRFKHRGDFSAGRLLADELAATLPTGLPEALVAVPLPNQRLRQRGFNQAAEVARRLPGRIHHDLVARPGAVTPQHVLTARQRRRNIRNAFRLRATPPERVMIVDDVVTSSATTRELARTLARAGCREIVVCSLARA
jgi:ComF family protein